MYKVIIILQKEEVSQAMGVLYRTFAVVIDWLFEGIENATTKALKKLRKISRWTVVLATKKSPVCPGFFS